MARRSKRFREVKKIVGDVQCFSLSEALDVLLACPKVNFDQTVEMALKIGIDPKKAEQQVRGTIVLPHGTGKSLRIAVFASGEKIQQALDAGAAFAGASDLCELVRNGLTDFDVVIAVPEMMREVGRLGKVLGPRGLMPSPKSGTVTNDVVKAIHQIQKGKIEFKSDRHGVCSQGVGKLSFGQEALVENIRAVLRAIERSKPVSAKGNYFISLYVSSTMGPGLKIDRREMPFV